MAETTKGNTIYDKCLPELLRENFRTTNNRSAFRSAFFTAARDDFDGQRDLFTKLKFDAVFNGFDIYKELGKIPDLGWFGPPDPYILPLMWKWMNKTLTEEPTVQLMMSLLVTGTHIPFPMLPNTSHLEKHYVANKSDVNLYLNAVRTSDDFLKQVIDGFKSRNLYNETLFVIVGDHGIGFNDHGRKVVSAYKNPLECAFLVPLMLHNPHLEVKKLDAQFTNMDVMPTIMDILLSSRFPQQSTNQLLSVPSNQLQSILTRYEGTSILRMPFEDHPVRHTFQIANPGDFYINVKQYPKKFSYDIVNDKVSLYHLAYDPSESIDLIALDHANKATHPPWLDVIHEKQSTRTWKGRWIGQTSNITHNDRALSQTKRFGSTARLNATNNTKVQLNDMLDWADQTFEMARLWVELVKWRYRNRIKIVV